MTQQVSLSTRSTVITIPEEIAQIRQSWAESKRQELAMAQSAYGALQEAGATARKLQRVREQIAMLRKVIRALDAGFVPIPRFDSEKLRLDTEELPLKAITAINEATAQRIFDELRLVAGRDPVSRRGPRGRITRRDPLVIGVVRTPEIVTQNEYGYVAERWSLEEHFLIAWWRPEDTWIQDNF